MAYPDSLDSLTNPLASDPRVGHATLHGDVNDAVEALEAKVGPGASLPEDGALLVSDGTDTVWTDAVEVGGNLSLSAPTGYVLLASDPAYIQASGDDVTMGGVLTQDVGGIFVKRLAGTDDPSAASGVAANVASVYLRNVGGSGVTGEMWVKTGALDTDWTKVV